MKFAGEDGAFYTSQTGPVSVTGIADDRNPEQD